LNHDAILLNILFKGLAEVLQQHLDAGRQENSHHWPLFLPDGRHFLFTARSSVKENAAIYVGSLDSKQTNRLCSAKNLVVLISCSPFMPLPSPVGIRDADRPGRGFLPLGDRTESGDLKFLAPVTPLTPPSDKSHCAHAWASCTLRFIKRRATVVDRFRRNPGGLRTSVRRHEIG
jgi:hypothetical protein